MNNANYMDGVPVKIAEKFKPPPAIYNLPQSLKSKLNLEENYYWNSPIFSYDIQLERKALAKIDQWKLIRQRDKYQRRDRIAKRELQRKREDDDRQKNLLFSVSYPSADDLSSGNEDEDSDLNEGRQKNGKGNLSAEESAPQICITEIASSSFHNILQPTVLTYNSKSSNVKNGSNYTTPQAKTISEGKAASSFNYKDFEDDTSSPFDNIELKTINDLDVLAQVLHNTQINIPIDKRCNDNLTVDTVNSSKEGEPEQSDSYIPVVTNENIPKNNNLPRFENYNCHFIEDDNIAGLRDQHNISSTTTNYVNLNAHLLTPQHQYYKQLQKNPGFYNTNDLNNCEPNAASYLPYNKLQAVVDDHTTKSRSVPDIIKELQDEVRNSEIRRYRNYTDNIEGRSLKSTEECLTNESTTKLNTIVEDNSNINTNLDVNGKKLVDQISAMGFPKKRVERIVNLVGADDKKVIEHLIPLSELADLGFEECEISKALIRNENNKNRALDELIS